MIQITYPEKLQGLFQPYRYKVLHGGRGGGKSHTIGRVLLAKGAIEKMRILCTREIQKSLKESVLRLLTDLIESMELTEFYTVHATGISGANGTEFLFSGLQDHTISSIKSYEGIDIVWVEEAQTVTKHSLEILEPTIREPGSELWFSFNATLEEDEVYQRFIVNPPSDAWVCKINWQDNPWFPDVLRNAMERMREQDHDSYMHIYGGECRSARGLMFKREWFQYYDTRPASLNIYMASDYAVTPDAGDYTEHGVFGMDSNGDLYALDWWSGQTSPEIWVEAWAMLVKQWKPQRAFEEKGTILRAQDGAINRAMRERNAWVSRVPLASASHKAHRALGFAHRASGKSVWLPKGKPWAMRLLNQLCAFHGNGGQVDDMVDVCSLIGRGLDSIWNAMPPAESKRKIVEETFSYEWHQAQILKQAQDAEQPLEYFR